MTDYDKRTVIRAAVVYQCSTKSLPHLSNMMLFHELENVKLPLRPTNRDG